MSTRGDSTQEGGPARVLSRAGAIGRAEDLARTRRRVILGITGPPGAGKSTLARAVADHLGPQASVVVAMDGFHLAQRELERLGRAGRKGAPDTFDAAGYVATLKRLRDQRRGLVYVPEFRRELEEPVAGAVAVSANVPLVITEGNYLLLDEPPWTEIRVLVDEVWFVHAPNEARIDRLISRHIAYGRSPDAARDWALGTDQANAELVAGTRHRADVFVCLP